MALTLHLAKMSGIIHMCERLTTTTPASPGQRHL